MKNKAVYYNQKRFNKDGTCYRQTVNIGADERDKIGVQLNTDWKENGMFSTLSQAREISNIIGVKISHDYNTFFRFI